VVRDQYEIVGQIETCKLVHEHKRHGSTLRGVETP
jgi:hypothetical protein